LEEDSKWQLYKASILAYQGINFMQKDLK